MPKLQLYLVKRYLRFDRSQPFTSIIGILSFIGVFIGVAILIISMALMNGMSQEFQKRLFMMNYPLTIYSSLNSRIDASVLANIKAKFPSLKFSPFLRNDVLIKVNNQMQGVALFGVDFESEKYVNEVIREATADLKFDGFDLLVGKGFYNMLKLFDDDVQKAQVIFTQTQPVGFSLLPKIKQFNIKSHFQSGLMAYDKGYAYTSIEALKKISRQNFYDGVHIYSDDPFLDKKLLKKAYPSMHVVGWWEQNGNFFQAQQLEKTALFIILMSIILIASLNIISSLLMTIMSRRREIALLLSMGMSKKELKRTFFLFGLVIGVGGILVGVLLGFVGIYVLGNFDIVRLPIDIYGTSSLPMQLDVVDFIKIMIGSFGVVVISSIYPAYKASEMDIIKVLRYE